jgi:hypothetical protein
VNRDSDMMCDRCGRAATTRKSSVGRIAWCHFCVHECTFTRGELETAKKPEGKR